MTTSGTMLHVVLVAPEIAGNAGNVIRMCANSGASLHLVEPLGFSMTSAALKRAGLDYHDLADVHVHRDWASLETWLDRWQDARLQAPADAGRHRYAFTSRAARRYDTVSYGIGDVVVFGAESVGLGAADLDRFDDEHRLALPMRPGNRSLNLANSAAIVVYEAWRQHGFEGAHPIGRVPTESLGSDPTAVVQNT